MDKITKEALSNGKNLSPEALEKRKSINKKILKFGCLPIIGVFVFIIILGIFGGDSSDSDTSVTEYRDPLEIGIDSVKSLVGKKVPYENWSLWGSPKTLEGTNNKYWVAYLDSANISFVSLKATDEIIFAGFEDYSAQKYLVDILEKRRQLIEQQLSGWDGSHRELTKVIKKSMNDPNSYEHVETVYWDMGDHLVVRTTFRGKNAFGGVVKNSVKAKTDIESGMILEIISQ